MENVCEARDIMVVQGDILEVYFQFTGIETAAVEKVYFVSKKSGIEVECSYVEEAGYCLRLTSEMTEGLAPRICSYDLIVKLSGGNTLTAIRQSLFAVLKKRNPLKEEAPPEIEPNPEVPGEETTEPEEPTPEEPILEQPDQDAEDGGTA